MNKKEKEFKYLLSLYRKVDSFLSNKDRDDFLDDILVCFCTVVEKILKIKLYKKNQLLIFEKSHISNIDSLTAIINKKDKNIETIKFNDVIDRTVSIFKNRIIDETEGQLLKDVYKIRNSLIHSHKKDNQKLYEDSDSLIKIMRTLWSKISIEAIKFYGRDIQKTPKKLVDIYTKNELDKILEEEVKKKLKALSKDNQGESLGQFINRPLTVDSTFGISNYDLNIGPRQRLTYRAGMDLKSLTTCPRCGLYGLYKEDDPFSLLLEEKEDGIYKCPNCNIELTEKEYEIAKKIKKE